MSTQKGNASRSRSQKYKNQTAFKNDLHDKSHRTKLINSLEVVNVCERCKKVIEWKIKYKKYKTMKAPAKCIKCDQKCVKHAYHKMCLPCAKKLEVCPKCCEKGEVIEGKLSKEESIKLDAELQTLLKELPERKRRTFIRYMNRNASDKKSTKKKKDNKDANDEVEEEEEEEDQIGEESISKEDLLLKLKELVIKEGKNSEDDFGSDFDDDDDDDLDSFI